MKTTVIGLKWAMKSGKGFYLSGLMVPYYGSNLIFCGIRDYHYTRSERIKRLN